VRLLPDLAAGRRRERGARPRTQTLDPEAIARVNPFFRDLYRETAADLGGLEAREHTAQVESTMRQIREDAFRDGHLPLLYCSPTMELGVDIAELNAVAMRTYAHARQLRQRSGRAGRSGQPALVITYCSTGSAHDQYYFRRSGLMVSGSVAPPRIDLTKRTCSVRTSRQLAAETQVPLAPR